MHWSRRQLGRPAMTTQTKGNAKVGSEKAQPAFVIVGADPADSGDASASQPKPSKGSSGGSSGDKGSSGQGGKN